MKENYTYQLKYLNERLHYESKIINMILAIIGKIGFDKRDSKLVPLINLKMIWQYPQIKLLIEPNLTYDG